MHFNWHVSLRPCDLTVSIDALTHFGSKGKFGIKGRVIARSWWALIGEPLAAIRLSLTSQKLTFCKSAMDQIQTFERVFRKRGLNRWNSASGQARMRPCPLDGFAHDLPRRRFSVFGFGRR